MRESATAQAFPVLFEPPKAHALAALFPVHLGAFQAQRLNDSQGDCLPQNLIGRIEALGAHDALSKLPRIQRAFRCQRREAELGCLATPQEPVQVDVGRKFGWIAGEFKKAEGGNDMRQIVLRFPDPAFVFGYDAGDVIPSPPQRQNRNRIAHAAMLADGGMLWA